MGLDSSNMGWQWVNVGTVGTVAVTNRSGVLGNFAVTSGTYTGTVIFHDAATTAGTTATSAILTVGLPGLNFPNSVPLNLGFKNGLVYQSTGTPSLTFGWN